MHMFFFIHPRPAAGTGKQHADRTDREGAPEKRDYARVTAVKDKLSTSEVQYSVLSSRVVGAGNDGMVRAR